MSIHVTHFCQFCISEAKRETEVEVIAHVCLEYYYATLSCQSVN